MVDSEQGGSSGIRSSNHPSFAAVAMALTLLLLAGPARSAAAQSDDALRDEINRLRDEREELRGEQEQLEQRQQELSNDLQSVTERVDALTGELAELQDEAAEMRESVMALEAQAARDRDRLGRRLSRLYRGAAGNGLLSLLSGATPTEVMERGEYLSLLARRDREGLEALTASTTALNREREELARTTARVETVALETKAAQAELDKRLVEAAERSHALDRAIAQRETGIASREQELARREEERRRAAEEKRQQEAQARRAAAAREAAERRRIAASRARAAEEAADRPARDPRPGPVPATGGLACPQDHPRSFTDTWGAARSGGRRHQGTDIFGSRGGDVFAIVDGVVTTTKSGGMAGLMLVLSGDDGHTYWYLHLQDFVAGPGQRVHAGELIGRNGDTGNARGTTPHIHFEYHPGGGGAANPYSLLRQACG